MWWLAHGEVDVPAANDWLSAHEREHLDSIRFTKRRNEYLTRRWTAKQAIAGVLELERAAVSLARIELRHHDSGAPHVHLDGAPAGVDVSMSDRSGWAVCLVGPPGTPSIGPLGVDVEVVEPRSQRFVADFFTEHEQIHMRSQAGDDQYAEAANLIWSAKEAALKVRQVGLRADTRTVEVHVERSTRPDGWHPLTVVGPDAPMPGWWRREGLFLLTIAYTEPAEPPQLMPGGAHLAGGVPLHSWVDQPRC